MAKTSQIDAGRLQRWMSALCLMLILTFTWMEAVHVHHSGVAQDSGTSCRICISAHSNAPVIVASSMPVLFTIESFVPAYEVEGKGIVTRLDLFTRPPPLL